MLDEFVSILENLLGVKRTIFSFTESWSKNPPAAAEGKPLQEYLKKVESRNLTVLFLLVSYFLRAHIRCTIMTHITNTASFEKIIDPLMARSHMLAQSFDFAGTILAIYFTRKRLTCVYRDIGSKISCKERKQAELELKTFRVWFRENVLKESSDSLSEAVLVLPAGKATPDYRDESNPFAHHITSTNMIIFPDTQHNIGLQPFSKSSERIPLQWF